ncbi:metallophosphoesterase [Nocardia sp. NPDC003726]
MTSDFPPRLSWIHISDLHFGDQKAADREHRRMICERMLTDIRHRAEYGAPSPSVLVLTGDIAATGGAVSDSEFAEASDFIRHVVSAIGTVSVILVVPGNHDIQRTTSEDRAAHRMIEAARRGEESIDDLLARGDDRLLLGERLSGYTALLHELKELDEGITTEGSLDGWERTITTGELTVQFIGTNTALLCNDDTDEGRLQLGHRQLRPAYAPAERNTVRVLLSHHPLSWLSDGDELEPLVNDLFDIHLYGHLHILRTGRHQILRDDGMVSIGAGVGYMRRGGNWIAAESYSYSIATISRDIRHGPTLQIWPRVWVPRAGQWQMDSALLPVGASSATVALRRRQGHTLTPATFDDEDRHPSRWERLSRSSVESFGRRRTAYPLDLTIGELISQSVNVPVRISLYQRRNIGDYEYLRDTARRFSVDQRSTILLGEPGAGKSVAVYELALAARDAGMLPVILRASDVRTFGERHGLDETIPDSASSSILFIIDGIDELTTDAEEASLAADLIKTLVRVFAVVVTCRRREYEEVLVRWIPTTIFDQMYSIKEWSVEDEFTQYVRKLVGASLLETTDILHTVRESDVFRGLVRRPLFARMLTYVGTESADLVTGPSSLYDLYLDRLSSACQTTLIAEVSKTSVLDIWRLAARMSFEKRLLIDDQINYTALEKILLKSMPGTSPETLRRSLSFVLDFSTAGKEYSQFVHYSFFEYLLADSVRDALCAGEQLDHHEMAMRLQFDLPRRVRHFLTEQLRTKSSTSGTVLVDLYNHVQQSGYVGNVRLTVCNLVAYIISRGTDAGIGHLTELMADEQDPFLRNSLMWALCHCGSLDGALDFVRELDASAQRRDLNRAYLLYYHGDLDPSVEPPFHDALQDWSFTRSQVVDMIGEPEYGTTVAPARQVIDLYTLMDFAISRKQIVTRDVSVVILNAVERLWNDRSVPVELRLRLVSSGAVVLTE